MRVTDVASEIIIIGAGIAGSSAALYLATLGHEPTVLDRGKVAGEASGLNMGGLGGSGWGEPPDLHGYLTVGSAGLFHALQDDLGYDIEFRLSGTIQAIQTEAEYDYARDRVLAACAAGHDLELLTTREARSIEPALSPALTGVVYGGRNRGQANPVKATEAFAKAAQDEGATFLTDCSVTGIDVDGSARFRLATSRGTVTCEILVLAAGAWCGSLGEFLNLHIPIVPVRGQMWASAPLPARIFHTIAATESSIAWQRQRIAAPDEPPDQTHHAQRRLTRHLYGRQNADGEVIFGGDRQRVGFDQTTDQTGIDSNKAHAAEILPFLTNLPVKRTWAGSMPFSLDGQPLIGALPEYENLYIVGGLASSGFGRGPMAGKLLAEMIHNGYPAQCLLEADPRRCVHIGERA